MAITEVNNVTYTDYETKTQKGSNENKTEKTYRNAREYGNYLTEKYDCLTNKNYPVTINSSLLQKAAGDEKTAQWLEYNLSIMPQAIAKEKAMIEARGAKIVSYNCTINGYDSMTTQVCTTTDPDGKIAKENTEKRAEERKKEEEKLKEKRAEKKEQEEKLAEQRAEKESQYQLRIDGKDVADTEWKFTDKMINSSAGTFSGSSYAAFDVNA